MCVCVTFLVAKMYSGHLVMVLCVTEAYLREISKMICPV